MKAREIHAIKEIEKRLNESKMQTQEGMVNEGIALNDGLDYEARTYDNTSTKQQDGSSISGYAADAERALVDKLDNQSIERDRLIGIGFVLNFVKFISFTFGDKEMISVIEAIVSEVSVKLLWELVES
ncbi:hypothetical protein Tco_0335744 [Tanacetum coccineum]